MSKAVLNAVKQGMAAIGMNYEYQEWTDDPVYPYFTGEYQEFEPLNEDGMQETSFILTGFTRGSYSDLEAAVLPATFECYADLAEGQTDTLPYHIYVATRTA